MTAAVVEATYLVCDAAIFMGGMATGLFLGRRRAAASKTRPADVCACGHPYYMRSTKGRCTGEARRREYVVRNGTGYAKVWVRCQCTDHVSPEQRAIDQMAAMGVVVESYQRRGGDR